MNLRRMGHAGLKIRLHASLLSIIIGMGHVIGGTIKDRAQSREG